MKNMKEKLIELAAIIDSTAIDDKTTSDFLRGLVRKGVVELKPFFDNSLSLWDNNLR